MKLIIESAMSDLDIEIKEMGGVDKFIERKKKELDRLNLRLSTMLNKNSVEAQKIKREVDLIKAKISVANPKPQPKYSFDYLMNKIKMKERENYVDRDTTYDWRHYNDLAIQHYKDLLKQDYKYDYDNLDEAGIHIEQMAQRKYNELQEQSKELSDRWEWLDDRNQSNSQEAYKISDRLKAVEDEMLELKKQFGYPLDESLLTEGMWSFPNTKNVAERLRHIMKRPITKSDILDKDILSGLIGDDKFYDVIADNFYDSDRDMRDVIKGFLKEWVEDYILYKKSLGKANTKWKWFLNIDDEALEILKDIINDPLNESNNPLKDAQKFAKRHQKGLGAFVKLNAGDVPKGVDAFNHAMGNSSQGSGGESAGGESSASVGMGESVDTTSLKELVVYNGAETEIDFKHINFDDSNEIGIHCGTLQAVKDLGHSVITKLTLSDYNEYKCDFDIESIWSSIELAKRLGDENLYNNLRQLSNSENKYKEYSKIYRKWFLDKGYNLISYINSIEDAGSTSYIILDTNIIKSAQRVLGESMEKDIDEIDDFFNSLTDSDYLYFVTEDANGNEGETFDNMDDAIRYVEQPEVSDTKVVAFANIDGNGNNRKSIVVYEYDNRLGENMEEKVDKIYDIRKELNYIDQEENTDLRNMYDALKFSDEEKKEIVKLLANSSYGAVKDFIEKKYNSDFKVNEEFESLKESSTSKNEWTDLFEDMLDMMEFTLTKYEDGWGLIDRQGGNLGDIESDRFDSACEIIERLDAYINDYILESFEESIEEEDLPKDITCDSIVDWYNSDMQKKYPDLKHDIKYCDLIANHCDDVSLEDCYHDVADEDTVGSAVYEIRYSNADKGVEDERLYVHGKIWAVKCSEELAQELVDTMTAENKSWDVNTTFSIERVAYAPSNEYEIMNKEEVEEEILDTKQRFRDVIENPVDESLNETASNKKYIVEIQPETEQEIFNTYEDAYNFYRNIVEDWRDVAYNMEEPHTVMLAELDDDTIGETLHYWNSEDVTLYENKKPVDDKDDSKLYGILLHSDMTDITFALVGNNKEKLKENKDYLWDIIDGGYYDIDKNGEKVLIDSDQIIKKLQRQSIDFVYDEMDIVTSGYSFEYNDEDKKWYFYDTPVEVISYESSRF